MITCFYCIQNNRKNDKKRSSEQYNYANKIDLSVKRGNMLVPEASQHNNYHSNNCKNAE